MKKHISFLFSVLFIVSIIASAVVNVSALDVIRGKSGDYEYKVYDGKYAELTEFVSKETIGGTYYIPSKIDGYTVRYLGYRLFSENDVPADKVVIPDTVTEIDNAAFKHYVGDDGPFGSRLREIVIPSGVSRIGEYAFAHCVNLKSVTLPGTLRSLGEGAFIDCTKLKSVTINEGLDTIPKYAFEGCTSLESINHLNGVFAVLEYAFFDCPKLKSLSVNEYTAFTKYSCGYKYSDDTKIRKKVKQKDFKLNITSSNSFEKYASNHAALGTAGKDYGIFCNYLTKSSEKKDIKLHCGLSFKIKIDGKYATKWKSTNPKVVKVTSSGKVTALKKGTVTLKATLADGSKYSRDMTVFEDPRLKKESVSVKVGKTKTVKISGKAFGVNNVYKNTKIAKITSKTSAKKLTVNGLKRGSTTLKVKVNGKTLKLKVKVV